MKKNNEKEHHNNNTPLTLGSLIKWCGGRSEFSEPKMKLTVGTVWNDSRKVTPGDVFVAIKTDRDDGHLYIANAFKAGAIAAIVDKKSNVVCLPRDQKKLIRVTDPLKALQNAANSYRKQMGILVVGVTGSNGKTTTRTFISSVLRQGLSIGETFGNWNNHIGVPLSILKFAGDEWAGVIEMGANHVGEIHDLSKIVEPDIAVITNVGYGHVGLFGSLANTTKAKFEIADGLNSKSGFMLLNGDDARLVKGARERGLPSVFYGFSSRCTVRPQNIKIDPVEGIAFDLDGYTFKLAMPGRHFIYSALPAIYIGRRCGLPDDVIAEALKLQKPVSMRGAVEMKKGVRFILDCYNANPSSMKSGITYLSDITKASKKIAIVGDMLELGSYSKRLHQQLGKDLAAASVKKILAVGEFAEYIAKGAIQNGFPAKSVITVDNAEKAVVNARALAKEGDTVLLKGSRGVHLETIFEQF
jgi:UDP-N-acetylmuramoyl-tripeptide--D-alanyl-D-alanine ligase